MGKTWRQIRVNGVTLTCTPMRPEPISYQDCDQNGVPLKRVTKVKGEYETVYEDGSPYGGDKFKLINGVPKKKLKRTEEVRNAKRVPRKIIDSLDAEEMLYCHGGEQLAKDLEASGEALQFPFTHGNGFKGYSGVLYPVDGVLVLRLARVNISKKIDEIKSQLAANASLEELQKEMDAQDRASEEDLIADLDL